MELSFTLEFVFDPWEFSSFDGSVVTVGFTFELWELGQCSGVGLEIDLKKIPIRQETIEICEFFDLNPYKLLSGGSLLLAAADGNALVHAIRQAGEEAVIIGRTIDSNDRVLINGEERRFLETTQTDELWNMVKCN